MEDSKIIPPSSSVSTAPVGEEEMRAAKKTAGPRYASDEQFEKAHRKTGALHADLFRRLAE